MMKKLETRFGDQELTETSRVKFQQARQASDESLDDWADRVLTLSTYAFKDLPEEYRMREAISKFCQGCIDREAGKHACFEHPRSIQAALNAVKHHQYISEAVDGKKHSRRSKDDVSINAVNTSAEARVEQLLNKAMEQLSSKIQQLTTTNKETESRTGRGLSCFFCKQRGHIKKDCPGFKEWLKKKGLSNTTEQQRNPANRDLNKKGLNGMANRSSPQK